MKPFEEKIEKLDKIVDEIIGEQKENAVFIVLNHGDKTFNRTRGNSINLSACMACVMEDMPELEHVFEVALKVYNNLKSESK